MNEIAKELLDALKACLKNCARWHPADPAVLGAISAIAKAEAALAEPQADADGWIPWSGGECPMDRLTQVDVRYRNGDELMGAGLTWLAGSYDWNHNWNHDESDYDIIAYRIAKGAAK